MTRRTLDLSDDTWQWLEDRATEAKMTYKGRPSRTAYIEALAKIEVGDSPPPPLAPPASVVSFEDAVEGLPEYQRNLIYSGLPGQPAALKRFYDLVVGGGKQ